jgi:DNA end-binding protein Ku
MEEMELSALARYAARGKDYLVLLRPHRGRMVMHQLYHADEIRTEEEVPAARREASAAELRLARQLIEQVRSERFQPEKYEDEVRKRIKKLIQQKVQGKDITEAAAAPRRGGQVVDLMEALKASLEQKGARRAPVAARKAKARGAARAAPRRRKAS